MDLSPRLGLPYIAPQQAQKQVTYNEAIRVLDVLVQPVVMSRTTATPPGSPAAGDTYIVAPSATGAWAGKDGKIATFVDGALGLSSRRRTAGSPMSTTPPRSRFPSPAHGRRW